MRSLPEEIKTLASGVFDPVSNTVGDDAVRLGLIVKNGLRPGDSGGEVNDSGEDIGPSAPNNVVLTGFNVCYYLADDPAYKALISDGADALREDCESGSVAVKEFSASGGTLIAESDAKPEDGSLVYASLLRAAVLEQLFGSSFDLAALSGVGFDAANTQSPNCAGTNVASDGTFDSKLYRFGPDDGLQVSIRLGYRCRPEQTLRVQIRLGEPIPSSAQVATAIPCRPWHLSTQPDLPILANISLRLTETSSSYFRQRERQLSHICRLSAKL